MDGRSSSPGSSHEEVPGLQPGLPASSSQDAAVHRPLRVQDLQSSDDAQQSSDPVQIPGSDDHHAMLSTQSAPPDRYNDAETRDRYMKQLKSRGNIALLNEIIEDDKKQADQSPFLNAAGETIRSARKRGIIILYAMPEKLKKGLIEGNLLAMLNEMSWAERVAQLPRQVEETPHWNKDKHKAARQHNFDRPCIYGFFHTTATGKTPSKKQYLQVLDGLDDYTKDARRAFQQVPAETADHHFIRQVDEWKSAGQPAWMKSSATADQDRKNGHRRYFSSEQSLDMAIEWGQNMRKRLDSIPPQDDDEPIPWALSEIGYTIEPAERRKAHESHSAAANRLMNLVEALAWHLLCRLAPFGDRFEMRWRILYQIFNRDQCEIAEHLLSRLAGSYVFMGGLNKVIGGHAIASAGSVQARIWSHWQDRAPVGAAVAAHEAERIQISSEWNDIVAIIGTAEKGKEREHARNMRQESRDRKDDAMQRLEEADHDFIKVRRLHRITCNLCVDSFPGM